MNDNEHHKELGRDWGLYSLYVLLSQRFDGIETQLQNIMTKISDFAAKQQAHNSAVDAALDKVNTSVTGITGDISTLNALIKQLQDSQGQISAEDQATLDQLEAAGKALEDKASALSDAAAAADSLTPPPVPTGTGTTTGPGA